MHIRDYFLHALTAIAFCASASAIAQSVRSNENATLTIVEGASMRIAPESTTDPFFHVRIVDAHGAPMQGIIVQFLPDGCFVFEGQPNACPPPELYGHFADQATADHVITDSDGVATAPAFVAGPAASIYLVAACVWVLGVPENAAVGSALCVDLEADQIALDAPVPITSAFTGAWYDPSQSGHGLLLEVLDGNRLLAYWFTFDPLGTQTWFGGVGRIENDLAILNVDTGVGGRWIPNFDPSTFRLYPWGTLMFQFSDCDHGRVDFTGDVDMLDSFGYGQMKLARLTHPAGLSCDP